MNATRPPRERTRWLAALAWGAVNVALFFTGLSWFGSHFVPDMSVLSVRNASSRAVVVVPLARSADDENFGELRAFAPRGENESLGFVRSVASERLRPGESVHFSSSGVDYSSVLDVVLLVRRNDGSWGRLAPEPRSLDITGPPELTIHAPEDLPDAREEEAVLARLLDRLPRPTLRTAALLAMALTALRIVVVIGTFRSPRWWLLPSVHEFIGTLLVFIALLASVGIALEAGRLR